jgi:hypothetical protein
MGDTGDPLRSVITKCWRDEAFKERLLADSAATLRAEGVRVPEGVTVTVVVDTEEVRTLVIPLAPLLGGLVDKDVTDIAVGGAPVDYIDAGPDPRPYNGSGSFFIDPQSDPRSLRYYRSRE